MPRVISAAILNICWKLKKKFGPYIFIFPFLSKNMIMKVPKFFFQFSTDFQNSGWYYSWHHGESTELNKSGYKFLESWLEFLFDTFSVWIMLCGNSNSYQNSCWHMVEQSQCTILLEISWKIIFWSEKRPWQFFA